MERTHAEISQLRDMIDFCRARGRAPPDHFYRDLDILHSKYDQLSLALAESRQAFAPSRHGRSPVVASPSVASPSDAPRPPLSDSSPFKGLRLPPQPGPSSSGDHRFALQDRRRPRLVRRMIRASRRSLPDPTRNGGVFGGRSLVPLWRSAAA